jgi:hypothetical protein
VSAEEQSRNAQEAWTKRRPAWSRDETARWLNDRSETLLALLRRRDAANAPSHSRNMGWWLQSHDKELFARAHAKLLGHKGPREKLTLLKVLS